MPVLFFLFPESSYFIKLIKPFNKSRDVEIRKAPRVYLCDSGLANCIVNSTKGVFFEQSIFQSLRLRGEVNYYRRKTGREIDFVINKKEAYEVKVTPDQTDVNKSKQLSNFSGINSYKIVSLNYSLLEDLIYGFET